MIISTENRATMAAYREGRTLEEYLSDIWPRRVAEHPPTPRVKRRRMKFPLQANVSNVTPIKRVRK